jgi:beta-N-acetylhexosaminidase
VADLRSCVGHHAPVFIDQEGGRVARLKPPHWELFPKAEAFAQLWNTDSAAAEEACYLNARLLAATLLESGIDADCAPVADLRFPGAHDVIGDRAFGAAPQPVIALARAQAQGLMDGGVYPVLKHIPGHGRALADSHLELPQVDAPLEELEATDFVPFKALADLPYAMTAHIRFTAIDADQPLTLSKQGIRYVREELGFGGLLMSDDITMKALQGTPEALSEGVLDAGCDLVLLCNSNDELRERVAGACRELPAERMAVLPELTQPEVVEVAQLREQRDALLNMPQHAIA